MEKIYRRKKSDILIQDRKLATQCAQTDQNKTGCIICGKSFKIFISPKYVCQKCHRLICRQCARSVNSNLEKICILCFKEKYEFCIKK